MTAKLNVSYGGGGAAQGYYSGFGENKVIIISSHCRLFGICLFLENRLSNI
jgi:TM2 domain-containing membrane protein YozV